MGNRVRVSTDGYVAQDGRAGWAFVAHTEEGATDTRSAALADTPSHLAEWIAVTHALAWAEETLLPEDTLELHTDSALVHKGLASRRPEMSGEAGALRAACRQALARLAARGVRTKVFRVRREENEEADALARAAALGEGTHR